MFKISNEKSENLLLFRILLLMAGILTPIITYLWKYENPYNVSSVIFGWIMCFLFMSFFTASYINRKLRDNLIYVVFIMMIASSISSLYFSYTNKFSVEYTMLMILMIFCVSIIFIDPIILIIYYVVISVFLFTSLYFSSETYIKKETLVSVFMIFFAISCFNAMSRYKENLYRKNSQEQLKIAKEKADLANIAKGQFLANMSHEIRTPINGIVGFLDLLSLTKLSNEQFELLEGAKSSTEILICLINDILDFSKIDAGKIIIEEIAFDLSKLLNDCVSMLYKRAHDKGLIINISLNSNIPNKLIGDPLRLKQIINNLLSNAVKFTEKGEININVNIESENIEEANLVFIVSDTGIGILEENISKLFSLFSQADSSTTRKYGGTGLGLAISKKLANLMNGDLVVESKISEGSSFILKVKFKKVKLEESELEESELEEVKQKNISKESFVSKDNNLEYNKLNKKIDIFINSKILLVEDNEINIKITVKMLEINGYTCDIAKNGKEALDLAIEKDYDLIFMDCQMPIMDGYQATELIRKNELGKKHSRIIAMTANAMQGDKEKCLECGMDDYISKPIKREEFIEKIKENLQKNEDRI